MFLKRSSRKKDGQVHHYWSIVENRRLTGGRVVQRHVLYLGEINSSQQAAWTKTIDLLEAGQARPRTVALFSEERLPQVSDNEVVGVPLSQLQLHRPRQWGACWLADQLWRQLDLHRFWRTHLPPSRKGTRWDLVLQTLVTDRLIDPGSEWRLHCHWFDHSAMADLLGADAGLAQDDILYRCHDRLLPHKQALFDHLSQRWKDLFNADYEVLLYDLTSTYFESDPPLAEEDKRKFGYRRDKRSDCVQVVIALVVTPEGFPLAYEVLPGNTADKTTLSGFLEKIENQYGKAQRIWLMDRGIPTEASLEQMRQSEPPVQYLVGTPKGQLGPMNERLAEQPWQEVREQVEVKLHADSQGGELYVLARSHNRVAKERSMRRRQLKKLWTRLKELRAMKRIKRDTLLLKLGAAKQQSPSAWRLVDIAIPKPKEQVSPDTFRFQLRKDKPRQARLKEGRYLLRTNLSDEDPKKLWELYMQLVQVEEAFKTLKGDLAIRPIHHQKEERIEAHIFIAFLAYCLQVTLRARLRPEAPGLTPRPVLEKFATMQMIDVHLPTTDGRSLLLPRHTQPGKELQLLLRQLKMELPPQPPPQLLGTATETT